MPKNKKSLDNKSEFLELKGFLSFLILHELNVAKLSGDELSAKIGKRRGSVLTPGTIYPALKRLRKNKLISYKRKGRKKIYSLTELGDKEIEHLYGLFSVYFYGLKSKIIRSSVKKKSEGKKRK